MDLKAETERFRAELRTTRWRKAFLYATVAGVVGLGSWVLTHYFFVAKEPVEWQAFRERVPDGVPIADVFLSYESMADVRAKLAYDHLEAAHSASHRPQSRDYPPRDLDTLEASGFAHLGQAGTLTLEFFNDRLYEATFRPEELGVYPRRLHAADKDLKRDKTGNIDLTRGFQRISSNVDFASTQVGRHLDIRAYVIWQDLRLKQQLKLWEETYGPGSVRTEK